MVLNEETVEVVNGNWLEMYADILVEGQNFNSSKNAQFVLEGKRDGKRLFWQNLNFQIYTDTGHWVTETWEYQPGMALEVGDQISAYIWNKQSPDTIHLSKVGLNVLRR